MYRVGELVYINLESIIFSNNESDNYPYPYTSTMIRLWDKYRTRKFVIIDKDEYEKDYYRIEFSNEEGEYNSSEDEDLVKKFVWHKDWLSYFPSTLVPSIVYGMCEDIRKFCDEQCIMKCLGEEDNRECLLKKYHPKAL